MIYLLKRAVCCVVVCVCVFSRASIPMTLIRAFTPIAAALAGGTWDWYLDEGLVEYTIHISEYSGLVFT